MANSSLPTSICSPLVLGECFPGPTVLASMVTHVLAPGPLDSREKLLLRNSSRETCCQSSVAYSSGNRFASFSIANRVNCSRSRLEMLSIRKTSVFPSLLKVAEDESFRMQWHSKYRLDLCVKCSHRCMGVVVKVLVRITPGPRQGDLPLLPSSDERCADPFRSGGDDVTGLDSAGRPLFLLKQNTPSQSPKRGAPGQCSKAVGRTTHELCRGAREIDTPTSR
jgi:hypothetical protein